MINKYRKKPVVIEAIRWDGMPETWEKLIEYNFPGMVNFSLNESIIISTLEGDMRCDIGDWIIKGINNEFYPCKNDIFEKTYEEAK